MELFSTEFWQSYRHRTWTDPRGRVTDTAYSKKSWLDYLSQIPNGYRAHKQAHLLSLCVCPVAAYGTIFQC